MMEVEELHADILRDPEPDDSRLAYADAVQRVDPDRAELVRVQVALLRSLRQGGPAAARADLYTRQRVLLDHHKERWAKDVVALGCVARVNFLRGFVEWVNMSARAFLDHAGRLYRVAPILHVDLTDVKPLARELFASPFLARLHSLGLIRNQLADAEIVLLATSPHLHRLRFLDLSINKIGQTGIEALCASDRLPSLRYLDFSDNLVPDPTPQVTETDTFTNEIVRIEQPAAGRELERR